MEGSLHSQGYHRNKIKMWFFAGGETRDDKFNVFTGSFIRLMKQIMEDDFDYVRGIYFRWPMMNVYWALSNAHKPISDFRKNPLPGKACRQILESGSASGTQLAIVSSSSGSVVAAQAACCLAESIRENSLHPEPFHLALGSSMISKESDLFRKLETYQREGIIGKFIHDDLQDDGDNSVGIAGKNQKEAFSNAFGLILPVLSRKFDGPSFLNTHPENGHFHRRRSQTVRKALDYINILMIRHNIAGDYYRDKAKEIIVKENPVTG